MMPLSPRHDAAAPCRHAAKALRYAYACCLLLLRRHALCRMLLPLRYYFAAAAAAAAALRLLLSPLFFAATRCFASRRAADAGYAADTRHAAIRCRC